MLSLYINGKQADIRDTSIIAVTKTYENVSNPLNYYSDFTKTINLPISPRNNEIFNNFNRLDNIVTNVTLDPTKKIPFTLLNNQEPVMEGYLKLENANTIYTDEKYEVTLFSTFGLIMNELKLLTFNPNAQDIDPKYIIDTPFANDVVIDRNLVKRSFEQVSHNINGNGITDWIGFIPTYQGKYTDFSSDREQLLPSGKTEDMSRERDEHYKREFRSYYQQPFIWVDKLWKVAKDKIEEITDYTIELDSSWFTGGNPYYKDLIYTCPSLFNSDSSNFMAETQVFQEKLNEISMHWYNRDSNHRLNEHMIYPMDDLTSGSGDIYANGIFNADSDKGTTVFKGNFRMTLFAYSAVVNGTYAKITDDNPLYIRFKAVNADTDEDIFGANKTFLIYSDDTDANTTTYDNAVDVGISERGDFPAFMSQRSPSYTQADGFVWDAFLDVELNVNENVPYRIVAEAWWLNNGKPFEWVNTNPVLTPTWDWLWTDFFDAGSEKGCSVWLDTVTASAETTDNNRSGSNITLYKIFPKETTICDVLLNYSKMFGLMWKVDDSEKTVTVMTRNKFFENYRIDDWSNKIDRSKEFRFSPLTFDKRYVEFNFEEGDCNRLKRYDDLYQLTYGTKKLDSGYEFNADTNKLFENLTPSVIAQKRQFSKMMNTEYEEKPNFMGYSYMVYPQEHYVDNDNNGESAGMSGAFYFRNGTFAPDPQLSNWDAQGNYVYTISDDTEHMIKTQEFCWNSCGENSTLAYRFPDVSTISNKYGDYNYSIHFEAPKEYYFDSRGIGDVKYIYDTFWRDYIDERYCSQNKKLTAYVYLSIGDYQKLDFTEFVNIDNILYHIDKVSDYNFNSDSPVKIELVQVWNLNAYLGNGIVFPYIYTDYTQYRITDNTITIPVHASDDWYVNMVGGDWLRVTKGDESITLEPTSTTTRMRSAAVLLRLNDLSLSWMVTVTQVDANARLNVTPETLVFSELGGTQQVLVDASNLRNNSITVTTGASWLKATIREYDELLPAVIPEPAGRSYLHLNITASPCTSTLSRKSTVDLRMDYQGATYTATVHVGQQASDTHRMDEGEDVIEDRVDFTIYDDSHTRVHTLIAGEQYNFDDYFPEEIDINSIQISNGLVSITGGSGLQTITFTPQLSDGDEAGGGVITVTTLSGKRISYPYNVFSSEPAPTSRRVEVKSDSTLGMFRLYTEGMDAKTTDYIVKDFNDGTEVKLTAVPNEGYAFSYWVDGQGNTYNTISVVFTVSGSMVGQDGAITFTPVYKEGVEMVTVTFNAGEYGGITTPPYLTIGSDSTHYTTVTRTVPRGTVIGNVQAHGTGKAFRQWSDGATANPRDYIANSNATITALYTTSTAIVIAADGNGLYGPDDMLKVYVDNTERISVQKGMVNSIPLSDNTYSIKAECIIGDNKSKFNSINFGSDTYYDNPHTASTNRTTTVSVVTIPSAIYYDYSNMVDTIKGYDQSALLNSMTEPLEGEHQVPTELMAELTVAIPTDYVVKEILNEYGDNVMDEQFTVNKTENGNWWVLYTDRSSETPSYILKLDLA